MGQIRQMKQVSQFAKKFGFGIPLCMGLQMLGGPSVQASEIQFGTPGYAGTACPLGSGSIVVGEDQKSLRLQFVPVSLDAGHGVPVERKACSLAIPITVAPGFKIALNPLEVRGNLSLSSGARAQLRLETFWIEEAFPRTSEKKFEGALSESFEWKAQISTYSRCGGPTTLRINFSALVQAGGPKAGSMKLDQFGDLQFQIRTCH